MMNNVVNLIFRVAFLLMVVVALVAARPQHFGDSNQDDVNEESNLMMENAARDRQFFIMGLRRMLLDSETRPDFGWDMEVPIKRQAGKRIKCYFNPVSCF